MPRRRLYETRWINDRGRSPWKPKHRRGRYRDPCILEMELEMEPEPPRPPRRLRAMDLDQLVARHREIIANITRSRWKPDSLIRSLVIIRFVLEAHAEAAGAGGEWIRRHLAETKREILLALDLIVQGEDTDIPIPIPNLGATP